MDFFGVGGVGNRLSAAGDDHRDGVRLTHTRKV
jgi:hypothetical protein